MSKNDMNKSQYYHTKTSGQDEIKKKKRKCLKCDKDFMSRNGYRLCEQCKSNDTWRNSND